MAVVTAARERADVLERLHVVVGHADRLSAEVDDLVDRARRLGVADLELAQLFGVHRNTIRNRYAARREVSVPAPRQAHG